MADQWQRERLFLLAILKLAAALAVLVVGVLLSANALRGLLRSIALVVTILAAWELALWAVRETPFDVYRRYRRDDPETKWQRVVRLLMALVFGFAGLLALRTEGLLQLGLLIVAATAGGCAWWITRRRHSRPRSQP